MIGAIALAELFIEAGGKIPDEDVVIPGKKSKKNYRLVFILVKLRFLQKLKEFIQLPRCSDDVDIGSDVTDGRLLFDCVNGGKPIIMLLFDTDAETLVMPFKLFNVESRLKPLFLLL